MNPHIFGRGSWFIFFQIFYYFIKNLIKKKNYINIIKNKNKTIEERIEYLNKFNQNYHDFILNNTETDLIIKINKIDIEDFKKKLVILISSLPCNDCKNHCFLNMNNNKILESENIYFIFHFFIELRNNFYSNKIDRNFFDTEENIIKNENILFEIIIKN